MITGMFSKVKWLPFAVTLAAQPLQPSLPVQKTRLVDLGLVLLSMGEMDAVAALTTIIRNRRLSHE
jgi:hypothetical protein